MSTVQIIGVGSPFGGDQIALNVINTLKPLLDEKNIPFKQCEYFDRPGLYLLEKIEKDHPLILIDAVMNGGKNPGDIYRFNDLSHFHIDSKQLSSHHFGLAETLALGQSCQRLPKHICIFGIEINQASTKELRNSATNLAYRIYHDCVTDSEQYNEE